MPYTIENFRHDVVREALGYMTPDQITEFFPDELIGKIPPKKRLRGLPAEERLRGLSADEVFRAFSPEEIRAYLKKLPKKATPAKKRGTKNKKSAESGNSAPIKKVVDNPSVISHSLSVSFRYPRTEEFL